MVQYDTKTISFRSGTKTLTRFEILNLDHNIIQDICPTIKFITIIQHNLSILIHLISLSTLGSSPTLV